MGRKRNNQVRDLKAVIRNNRQTFILWAVLRLLVIAVMVLSVLRGDYASMFVCLLVLVLFLIPAFIQKNFGIEFPSGLQIVILLHIFATEILGELSCYYVRFPHWDTIMHTVWGFLCAAVGFSLVDILNRDNRAHFNLSPAYLALVAFCFSMTIGVIWEFFEFGMDNFFHMDMQKDTVIHAFSSVNLDPTASNIPVRVEDITDVAVNGTSLGLGGYLDIGLYDTMEDLFVNFIGALTFSVIGYFSAKSGKNSIAKNFVPVVVPEEAPASEAGQTNAAEDTTEKNTD